ncbi:MAG: CHC2 zinc finger domain-containing protein [Armatimonadota bacterium]
MSFLDREIHTQVPPDEAQRPILEVAEELGIAYRDAGNHWYGAICPVHDDNDPSLRLNDERNYWTCYGCDTGGSAAHLYKHVTGCTMETAIAATIRAEVDALDVFAERAQEDRTEKSVVALNLILVKRLLDDEGLNDSFPMDAWMCALYESANTAELLLRLRQIA